MQEKESHQPPSTMSRRGLLKLGVALNALAGILLGIPLVGFLASAARKKQMIEAIAWIPLGDVSQFPEGETRLATFRNPLTRPWDGATGDIPCWVRRLEGENFQVFAINCTHLVAPFDGSPSRDSSCVRAMVERITRTVSGPPVRRHVGCSNIRRKSKKASCSSAAG